MNLYDGIWSNSNFSEMRNGSCLVMFSEHNKLRWSREVAADRDLNGLCSQFRACLNFANFNLCEK